MAAQYVASGQVVLGVADHGMRHGQLVHFLAAVNPERWSLAVI